VDSGKIRKGLFGSNFLNSAKLRRPGAHRRLAPLHIDHGPVRRHRIGGRFRGQLLNYAANGLGGRPGPALRWRAPLRTGRGPGRRHPIVGRSVGRSRTCAAVAPAVRPFPDCGGTPRSASAVVAVGDIESAADPSAAIEPYAARLGGPVPAPVACPGGVSRSLSAVVPRSATANWRPIRRQLSNYTAMASAVARSGLRRRVSLRIGRGPG
jgi:hypothetical protein